jgi:hypothetical protein
MISQLKAGKGRKSGYGLTCCTERRRDSWAHIEERLLTRPDGERPWPEDSSRHKRNFVSARLGRQGRIMFEAHRGDGEEGREGEDRETHIEVVIFRTRFGE